MRNVILITLLLLLSLSSCIVVQDGNVAPRVPEYQDFRDWQEVSFTERKSEHDATIERIYTVNFDHLLLDVPIKAEILSARHRPRIEIRAPEKILKRLIVEKERGYLSLRFGPGSTFFNPREVQLRIYVNRLLTVQTEREIFFPQEMVQPQLEIRAKRRVEGDFKVDRLSIEMLEGGGYTGIVRGDQLRLTTRDNSHIEVYGKVREVQANAENTASIDGKGLNAEAADLHAKQGATMVISVSRSVQARVSDDAEIRVFGDRGLITSFIENGNGRILLN